MANDNNNAADDNDNANNVMAPRPQIPAPPEQKEQKEEKEEKKQEQPEQPAPALSPEEAQAERERIEHLENQGFYACVVCQMPYHQTIPRLTKFTCPLCLHNSHRYCWWRCTKQTQRGSVFQVKACCQAEIDLSQPENMSLIDWFQPPEGYRADEDLSSIRNILQPVL